MNVFAKILSYPKKYTFLCCCTVAFLFIVVLSFQGFDVCDEGFYLSSYQQIFNHPESVEYSFVYWFSVLVGGLWFELFPNGGILSFRILTALVTVSCFAISYKLLIKYIGKFTVVVGLFMVLLISNFGFLAFYYNHLSSLLVLLAIMFLHKGLISKKSWLISIAGCIIAVNIFSRLPNVLFLSFGVIFPIQLLFNKEISHIIWIKQLLYFLTGTIIGLLIVFSILFFLDQLDIMQNALELLGNKGSSVDSNHNILTLLKVYLRDYYLVFKNGFKVFLVLVVFGLLSKFLNSNRLFKLFWFISGVIIFSYILYFRAIYTLYALSFFGYLYIIIKKGIDVELKYLSMLAIMMTVLLPLGSDGGINNVGYVSVWLGLPIFIWSIYNLKNINNQDQSFFKLLHKLALKSSVGLLIVGYVITKLFNISNEAYFDKGSRLEKTHSINSHLACYVYTTNSRADIINDVLIELQKYVGKDDYLLAYDKIPMINYLTQTKPYMYMSWVWVYDSTSFQNQLLRAEDEIEVLPIVVQQKFETISEFSNPDPSYMSEDKEETYHYSRGRVKAMNAFLKRNNYSIIWSNPYFNIYKTNN